MCGIVTIISSITTAAQVKVFEEMLHCDALRGKDSTGVFTKDGMYKKAVMPSWFLQDRKYKGLATEYIGAGANFMVGHNRLATMGVVNDRNAHPFKSGNITLVHNGTLRNQSLLPKSDNFEVDSENIAYSINSIGVKETIAKLNGAFTLIWKDSRDDTLHIIRNSERPFFIQKAGSAYYGASEEHMLKWVLKRNKIIYVEDQGFEIEPMVEYTFEGGELISWYKHKPFKASAIVPATQTQTKTYIPPATEVAKSKKKTVQELLDEHGGGLKAFSKVDFVVEKCYQVGSSKQWRVEGYEMDTTENVVVFGLHAPLKEDNVYASTITGAWMDTDLKGTQALKIYLSNAPIENKGSLEEYEFFKEPDILVDSVWTQCSMCSTDIYESEREAVQEAAIGIDHLCLDCIEAANDGTLVY